MAEIRFQLDEHIADAIAEGLRRRGVDVTTASDAGLRGESDEGVLAHALAAQRVVVTQDVDYLRLHGQQVHAGIAFSRHGTRSIGELIAGLLLIHEVLSSDDVANDVQFL